MAVWEEPNTSNKRRTTLSINGPAQAKRYDIHEYDACMYISERNATKLKPFRSRNKDGKRCIRGHSGKIGLIPLIFASLEAAEAFLFSHHTHSGHKWACFCRVRGVLVPNVSLTPKSQCYCTANRQGKTFSPVSPACLEAPCSCQSHTSCQISEPFLLQVCPLRLLFHRGTGATKIRQKERSRLCCSCHPYSYMKIASQSIHPSHPSAIITDRPNRIMLKMLQLLGGGVRYKNGDCMGD